MPKNYFINRQAESLSVDRLHKGDMVLIIEKQNQGSKDTKDLVKGRIMGLLSREGEVYKNGAKVKILLDPTDWRYPELGAEEFIGRVQYVIEQVR